jgi:hypothetical protein
MSEKYYRKTVESAVKNEGALPMRQLPCKQLAITACEDCVLGCRRGAGWREATAGADVTAAALLSPSKSTARCKE